MPKPEIIFIVGPTASGKTETAFFLAKMIKAEIISCDSMQVYKGMDIITSKPSANLRKIIPHHLISVVSAQREYNVSRYRNSARRKARQIIKKGKPVIFAGGTGLYFSVLIDGIFKGGGAHKALRERLYRMAGKFGRAYIYKKLQKADARSAAKIHPHDTKRIVRALEVYQSTGKPISLLQKQRSGILEDYRVRIFCLEVERRELYRRIEQRLERMFAQGLIPEAKKLLKLRLSRTAGYAIGIRELNEFFKGRCDLESAKAKILGNTRNYAKRQISWFRRDKRIKWISVKKGEQPKETARRIWRELY